MKASLKRLVYSADRVVPSMSGVTTLIYHYVGGGSRSSVDLPIAQFERQVEWLAASSRVVNLSQAVSAVRAGDTSIHGSIVITFDDGTADFCDIALPVLLRHGLPATLYAETEPISTGQPNASGRRPTSWSALRDATSTGMVSVECHTHTHQVLRRASSGKTASELDRACEVIAHEIGQRPNHFAYPKGELGSKAARHEVARRFASAAVGGGRPTAAGGDVMRWRRTPVQRDDSFEMFMSKANGGMWLEGVARQAVSRVRYRKAAR